MVHTCSRLRSIGAQPTNSPTITHLIAIPSTQQISNTTLSLRQIVPHSQTPDFPYRSSAPQRLSKPPWSIPHQPRVRHAASFAVPASSFQHGWAVFTARCWGALALVCCPCQHGMCAAGQSASHSPSAPTELNTTTREPVHRTDILGHNIPAGAGSSALLFVSRHKATAKGPCMA